MRIVLSCLQALRQHQVPAYDFWRTYLVNGCREAGIECVEVPDVDWVEGIVLPPGEQLNAWRTRSWDKTVSLVRRENDRKNIDFFLGYLYPQMVLGGAIREIQDLGIPCVNFFCDNVREFSEVPEEYQCFDLNWVPEHQAISMYERAGMKYIHAAMPCWIPPEQRTCEHPETEGLSFIGSPDELRRHLLSQAIQLGADINIYGVGWLEERGTPEIQEKSVAELLANQWREITRYGLSSWLWKFERKLRPLPSPPSIPVEHLRGWVSPDSFVRVMQQSEVTLGINRVTTRGRSLRHPITYSRLRDIEATMMGACYLTEWSQDLEHLFEVGREIETYRTPEELKDKYEALHGDPERRRTLRKNGQARALNEHVIGRTLQRIFQQVAG